MELASESGKEAERQNEAKKAAAAKEKKQATGNERKGFGEVW